MTIPFEWRKYTEPDGYPFQLEFLAGDPGDLYALAFQGIWASSDGIIWQQVGSAPGYGVTSFEAALGRVAYTDSSYGFRTSTDLGVTWQVVPLPNGYFPRSVAFHDGVWYVATLSGSSLDPRIVHIWQSVDMISWNQAFGEEFAFSPAPVLKKTDGVLWLASRTGVVVKGSSGWSRTLRVDDPSQQLTTDGFGGPGWVLGVQGSGFGASQLVYSDDEGVTWLSVVVPPHIGEFARSAHRIAAGCLITGRQEDFSEVEFIATSWGALMSAEAFAPDPSPETGPLWAIRTAKRSDGNSVMLSDGILTIDYSPPKFWVQLVNAYEAFG